MTESAVVTTAFGGHQTNINKSSKTHGGSLMNTGTTKVITPGGALMSTSLISGAGAGAGAGRAHGHGHGYAGSGTGTGTATGTLTTPASATTTATTCTCTLAGSTSTISSTSKPSTGAVTSMSQAVSTNMPAAGAGAYNTNDSHGTHHRHHPSSSPPAVAAAAGGHDLDDAYVHVNGHDSPSLKLHSHRQSHTSSKLPSFRAADVKSGSSAASSFPSQPQPHPHMHRLHHNRPGADPGQAPHSHHGAPSPALPNPVPENHQAPSIPDNIANTDNVADEAREQTTTAHPSSTLAASPSTNSPPRPTVRSRASSYHTSPESATSSTSSPSGDLSPVNRQRPVSCPESGLANVDHTSSPSSSTGGTKYLTRRGPASRSSNGVSTSDGPPPSLNTQRLHAVEAVARTASQAQGPVQAPSQSQHYPETPKIEGAQGQRDFLLLKRLSESSASDEGRQSIHQRRPPVSGRSTNKRHSIQPAGNLPPGQVAPIRGLRSSGSRRSLTQDMNFTPRPYDLGESYATSPEDHTLHNFGGRQPQGGVSLNNTDSGRQDDGGDVFLRIAREEPVRRLRDEENFDETQSSVSGVRRTSHRRPLSTFVPSYQHQTSPPRARRLSDQQDRPRPTHLEDDQGSEISRTTTFRSLVREKAASVHPGDDIQRTRSGGANLRPSPLSARSTVGYDNNSQEGSIYARRRASITDSHSTLGARSPGYRASGLSHSRNHGSSPLVKTIDFQSRAGTDGPQALEGTESTASTTAPSTVWDELDDLKSRINRLELTGKIPPTSGAAISRMSDERPATATTTVTTMSGSPKRQLNGQIAEVSSTTSSQKEAHPILHAALLKSRPFLSSEVYQALESAANDAMVLSSMMGIPGQPGPISSAASVIGAGPPHITDRQLRRKADSVCRSLTELCVALGEGVGTAKAPAPTSPPAMVQHDGPATPTIPKSYSGLPAPRRPSVAEQGIPKSISSPRAMSKFEERRSSILNGTSLPSPRPTGSTPTTPIEGNPQRRSSLMISRTRRAGTEEPELARTPTTILRSRRAGTEEPEEGRQTSFFSRNRRGTVGEDGDEGRFRPPSRAGTDVNMLRGQGREYAPETQATQPDHTSQVPSALPRRRFLSTNHHPSRLASPAGSNSVSPRRYYDRQTGEQDMAENSAESPVQRQGPPLSKGIAHTRTSSLSTRRNRDSMISSPGAATGSYR